MLGLICTAMDNGQDFSSDKMEERITVCSPNTIKMDNIKRRFEIDDVLIQTRCSTKQLVYGMNFGINNKDKTRFGV